MTMENKRSLVSSFEDDLILLDSYRALVRQLADSNDPMGVALFAVARGLGDVHDRLRETHGAMHADRGAPS